MRVCDQVLARRRSSYEKSAFTRKAASENKKVRSGSKADAKAS
jgi:hypothetical protein